MAKGDDAVRKKRNKAHRKKMNGEKDSSSSVSARVAAIIAAKKRRMSGKRRQCQGMCFSLPTRDDPFNDRNGQKDPKTKIVKKVKPSDVDEIVFVKGKKSSLFKQTLGKSDAKVDDLDLKVDKVSSLKNEKKKSLASINNGGQLNLLDPGRTKTQVNRKGGVNGLHGQANENLGCPSKYLIMCLNEIESALRSDGSYITEEDGPLFASTWGNEFWKCYSAGKDILETSGTSSSIEQIAWIVCSAADTISRKDEEGLSCTSPFLLFLVQSKEKAAKVRSVCKALKVHGVHAVSIHPGSSLDHQIQGLKNCEPEILIATPERLLELVSLKAIDISGVSLLVIDGLESQYQIGYLDTVKDIAKFVSENAHHLVFSDSFGSPCVPVVQNLLVGPLHRLSLNTSITSQSACSSQSVKICNAKEEKLSKVRGEPGDRTKCAVSIIYTDQIGTIDVRENEVNILDSVLSIESYIQLLTRMTRYTVNGVLHGFLSEEDARLAQPLIEILEKYGQAVPNSLRNMSLS